MSFLNYASMLKCTYSCYSTAVQKTTSAPSSTWSTLPDLTPLSPTIYLGAAGLLVLTDLTAVAKRTALTGGVSLLDILVLCPGLHRQQLAANLHQGEYPAVAAMTTGYVFRVENPAMVFWLQRVSRTAQLSTVTVESSGGRSSNEAIVECWYFMCIATTIASLLEMRLKDVWFVVTISLLIASRALNYLVLRSRTEYLWSGAPEPGVKGDLLVLLSQDRWVRMRGLVDDLKAVTSGTWLRPASAIEGFFTSVAAFLTYLAVVLAANMSQRGQLVFMGVLVLNAGMLGWANHNTTRLRMFGRSVFVDSVSRRYGRRLKMVEELVEEVQRDDWAVRLGMIGTDKVKYSKVKEGEVIM